MSGAKAKVSQVLRTISASNNKCPAHSQSPGRCNILHPGASVGNVRYHRTSYKSAPEREYAFEMTCSNIRYGTGVTKEVGMDVKNLEIKKVCLVTDRNLAKLPPVKTVLDAFHASTVSYSVFDEVSIEPTNRRMDLMGFLAVGGGSVMDTAKAANLYSCYPEKELMDFVNAPIGKGEVPEKTLHPLICVPTTSGTGSETTGVCIFDHKDIGITAKIDRPAYQGSNPISDIWSLQALRIIRKYFKRSVFNPEDEEARSAMHLASTYAGIGFGNAGVHLCHGMSYPISANVDSFFAEDYNRDKPLIPHGLSVVVVAPAVFKFTAPVCPEKHLQIAEILGADISKAKLDDAGYILSDILRGYMHDMGVVNGLQDLGYSSEDIPQFVQGTLPQERVTKNSPRSFTEEQLAKMFEDSLRIY